jgi:hypothetical protein
MPASSLAHQRSSGAGSSHAASAAGPGRRAPQRAAVVTRGSKKNGEQADTVPAAARAAGLGLASIAAAAALVSEPRPHEPRRSPAASRLARPPRPT